VITGLSDEVCIPDIPLEVSDPSGYLASTVTMENGKGSPECPWRILVSLGQRINITLVNFHGRAMESLPVDSRNVKVVRVCYQLAIIREAHYFRTLTECDGSPRYSPAYMSSTNSVDIGVLVTKTSKIYFLLHYQSEWDYNNSIVLILRSTPKNNQSFYSQQAI